MALIDADSRKVLKEKFAAELTRTVNVEVYRGKENPETVDFSIELMKELSELSDSITYEVKDIDDDAEKIGVTASPSLLIGRDLGYRIEYWGAPLGLEAQGFIDTLMMVSRGESGLKEVSQGLLRLLEDEVRLYSFVTPTCPHCPDSVMQNARLALEAPGKVRAIAVEAQENLDLARKYNVRSVPQQMFNEDVESVTLGKQPETKYVTSMLHFAGVDEGAIEATSAELKKALLALPDNPGKPVTVTDDTFDEAVSRYPFLVVDCWAEWCGPCRMMSPVLDELASEYDGKATVAKVNVDNESDLAQKFQVMSIPTIIVFKDGEVQKRFVGVTSKSDLAESLDAAS